jgi:hypothetical protein
MGGRDPVVVYGTRFWSLFGGTEGSVMDPPLQRTTNLELERTRGIRLFN